MTTARGYFLVLATGLLLAPTVGAEDFKCDQAARFGFADPLCDPLQTRIAPIAPLEKPDASKESRPFDVGAAASNPASQAEIYRQAARANQWAWDNYRRWNPASPVFPRGTFPGGEWSPLKLPSFGLPDAPSSSTQEGRAIKH